MCPSEEEDGEERGGGGGAPPGGNWAVGWGGVRRGSGIGVCEERTMVCVGSAGRVCALWVWLTVDGGASRDCAPFENGGVIEPFLVGLCEPQLKAGVLLRNGNHRS